MGHLCARGMVCERKACSVICLQYPWGSRIATPDYLRASAPASEVNPQREIEPSFSHLYLLSNSPLSSYFPHLLSWLLNLFPFISSPPFVPGVFSPLCSQRSIWWAQRFWWSSCKDFFHLWNISKVSNFLLWTNKQTKKARVFRTCYTWKIVPRLKFD